MQPQLRRTGQRRAARRHSGTRTTHVHLPGSSPPLPNQPTEARLSPPLTNPPPVAPLCAVQHLKGDNRFFRDALSRLRSEAKDLEAKNKDAAATIAALNKDLAKVHTTNHTETEPDHLIAAPVLLLCWEG